MRLSLVALCGFAASAFAVPTTTTVERHVVHEKRDNVPQKWKRTARLTPDSVIPIRIALTQQNLHLIEDHLLDVSDPDSANYGKHWSAKEVAETYAPSDETYEAVGTWLSESGITGHKQSQSLNWIHAEASVAQAESLLKTSFYEYTHETGHTHIGCDSYQVPAKIQKHIDFITPTVHFDAKVNQPRKKRSFEDKRDEIARRSLKNMGAVGSGSLPKDGGIVPQSMQNLIGTLESCDLMIVPDCLRALYLFPEGAFFNNAKNSYAVVEYTTQAFLQSDLDLFFANFTPALVGATPIFDSIDGGVDQTTDQGFEFNGESDLDLEYAMSLVFPQVVTLYQAGDVPQGASFNNFLDAIDASYCTFEGGDDPTQDGIYPDPLKGGFKGPENCGGFAATNVISTSYGADEVELTAFYAQRQCAEYAKLGLQGVTILYSSGDDGVAGNGGACISPDGQENNGTSGMFNPSFPGGCPFVTSVGATQVKVNSTVTQPEEAAESVIFSGGGFSNIFEIPSYQVSAQKTYFAEHNPPYTAAQFNRSGVSRGFPDVAANGVNYIIAVDGNFSFVFGTSCSSPVFGSILTLINAARLDEKKSPIGFINPTLYKNPEVLNDITQGGNQGCGTPGFESVTGWDPVTGLGTPNFPKMLALWLSLP